MISGSNDNMVKLKYRTIKKLKMAVFTFITAAVQHLRRLII